MLVSCSIVHVMTCIGGRLFRSRALDMEDFKTEVNILPGAKVQFELHYQEVKWRKLGSYEHRLHLQPGRLAKHLEVSMDGWAVHRRHPLWFLSPIDTFCLTTLCVSSARPRGVLKR